MATVDLLSLTLAPSSTQYEHCNDGGGFKVDRVSFAAAKQELTPRGRDSSLLKSAVFPQEFAPRHSRENFWR